MQEFKHFIVLILLLSIGKTTAQGTITIEHKTKRFIGDISMFDRGKYVNAHISEFNSNSAFESFKAAYNISADYPGGRQFWYPISKVKDGVIPSVSNKFNGVRTVFPQMIATQKETKLFYDDNLNYAVDDISQFSIDLADYVARSLKDDWARVAKYLEPLNEPMIHAKNYIKDGFSTAKVNAINVKICNFYRDLGQAVHATPELANVKMMGYAAAFPEYESGDFQLWNDRFKMFIDIAGEDMDVFSIHLYDGVGGVNNKSGRRSGSNSEAILDLIETYSFIRLGVVKPLAVSEFGRLVPNQPGWTANNGTSNYEPITNSQAVRSQLHMIMNFMERTDKFEIATPFNTELPDFTSQFSKSSIWINDTNGVPQLTMRKYFYEMMKDLEGYRVWIESDNIDVQTQAFVKDNKLVVMLNNLNDITQTIDLNLVDATDLASVDIKTLKIFEDKVPELTETTVTQVPNDISLVYGETAVLTYNFNNPVQFDDAIQSKKYHCAEYLKPINANTDVAFPFTGVVKTQGKATLRLGVARAHGLSLTPEVRINGTQITYPSDVVRGYDQLNRGQFFGLMEIPFNIDLLNNGQNTVSVRFNDGGGRAVSAILQVHDSATSLSTEDNQFKNLDITMFPNPVKQGVSAKFNDGKAYQYELYTITGQKITKATGDEINTSGLGSGIYIIHIKDENHSKAIKLVVE